MINKEELKKSTEQLLSGLSGVVSFANDALEQVKKNLENISPEHAQKLAEAMKAAQGQTDHAAKSVTDINNMFKNL